jgi:hypothetical protein
MIKKAAIRCANLVALLTYVKGETWIPTTATSGSKEIYSVTPPADKDYYKLGDKVVYEGDEFVC